MIKKYLVMQGQERKTIGGENPCFSLLSACLKKAENFMLKPIEAYPIQSKI